MELAAQDAAFREEMAEQLELAERCLLALEECARHNAGPHAASGQAGRPGSGSTCGPDGKADPDACLEHLQGLFRAFHTIKGLAGMVGCKDVAELTHALESVLEPVRRGGAELTPNLMELVLAARDLLADAVQRASCSLPGAAMTDLIRALNALAGQTPPSGIPTPSPDPATAPGQGATGAPTPPGAGAGAGGWCITFTPTDPATFQRVDMLELLQSLRDAGAEAITPIPQGIARLEDVDPVSPLLAWSCELPGSLDENAVRDLFIFVEDAGEVRIAPRQPEPLPASPGTPAPGTAPTAPRAEPIAPGAPVGMPPVFPAGNPGESSHAEPATELAKEPATELAREPAREPAGRARNSSVHVDAGKLDAMVALVGELVIAQSRLTSIAARLGDAPLQRTVEELDYLAASLRDQAMAMRMTPIGTLFARLRRLVRDQAREAGKDAILITHGGETELDRAVIEQLGTPLVHLLRNAVIHGLEMPDIREAAGKPRRGLVELTAGQAAGAVCLTIRDDGRGLDREAILAKAQRLGLARDGQALADEDIFELLFDPEFCAAGDGAHAPDDADRESRLDAIRRSLDGLRGSLSIAGAPGQGLTAQVKLPLTMAIIEGLQVRVGTEQYIIPLAVVEECVELPAAMQQGNGARSTARERLLPLRGELVPCLSLRALFAVPEPPPAMEHVVVTMTGGQRTGLVVDAVLGQQQAVIKSLGVLLRQRTEFAGAAVQGDGSLALILDVLQVVHSARAARGA
ncbi:chemotaxis protein CheA [Megalodesulfovibrio paquesii]